ncbi:MAG: aminotransferase class V-fold PLP-dependent enzyme [Phycisphaerales bacterium]|nr:aminotransferase class V-fold PLP-dependent enzyme [Phycisphaerales bacterium]
MPSTRYFDNAATSFPKPPAVLEAMTRYMTECGAPSRGAHAPARSAAGLVRRCRQRLATLVGLTSPEHVVFGYNTSDGLNLGVKGVYAAARRVRGQAAPLHIVITAMEHNSILRPVNALRELDPNLSVTIVSADPATGLIDPADIARAIRPGQTVLVCVNHASNVTGTVQDLDAIGRECARFGAGSSHDGVLLLVDAAQSLGHVDVNMLRSHIDLLAFPGHKGLLGPTGVGGLCIRPGVERRLDTIREGGTGNLSEQLSHPSALPEKYEPGSHNTMGIIGLSEGVAWLLERGIVEVRQHEVALMQRFIERLAPDISGRCEHAPGLRLLGPLEIERRVGVFTFVHDELSPQELAMALESSFGVLTRAGLHCAPLAHELMGTSASGDRSAGGVRLSFGPFLTVDDVEHAARALCTICSEHRSAAAIAG